MTRLHTLLLGTGLTTATLLAPGIAAAHTGAGVPGGLLAGLGHPIGGLDHVLAMVAVGLLAAQRGGKALWLLPLAFLSVMAVGGALGVAGIAVPFVEGGIALSVVVLGAALALNLALPTAALIGLVGLFAVFHGHAHGGEMPAAAAGLAYGVGFLASTAALHLAGVAAGLGLGRLRQGLHRDVIARAGGAGVAVAGAGLLAGGL